jgi:hypothetical protein
MKTACLLKYERPTPQPSPCSSGAVAARLPLRLLVAAAAFVVFVVVATNAASAQQIPLTLLNNWSGAPFGTNQPSVEIDGGIIRFRGAIAGGDDPDVFDMPPDFTTQNGYVPPVDMCDATLGALVIAQNIAFLDAENGNFNNAQCFTSLDGVSYPLKPTGYSALKLINGWQAIQNFSKPSARLINGIVHFAGAIASGATSNPFVMPVSFRPATTVFIPVVLSNINNGRLQIDPDGTVTIETEDGSLFNAQSFTSLDGAWYAKNASGFTPLQLIDGWTNAPYNTSNAGVKMINGVVTFKGAIALGTTAQPFVLPQAFWPQGDVYVHADLCMTTNGRLFIQPNGTVTIQEENGDFANAQCFTSLDGVSFVQ